MNPSLVLARLRARRTVLEHLNGAKILGVNVIPDELGQLWTLLTVELSSGATQSLYVCRDEEGNGPGSLIDAGRLFPSEG